MLRAVRMLCLLIVVVGFVEIRGVSAGAVPSARLDSWCYDWEDAWPQQGEQTYPEDPYPTYCQWYGGGLGAVDTGFDCVDSEHWPDDCYVAGNIDEVYSDCEQYCINEQQSSMIYSASGMLGCNFSCCCGALVGG